MVILVHLWLFGIFFSRFGMVYQEKSGNPELGINFLQRKILGLCVNLKKNVYKFTTNHFYVTIATKLWPRGASKIDSMQSFFC
jgi:hypothetical protein